MAKKTENKSTGNGKVLLPKFQEIAGKVSGSIPTSVKTPPPPKK